MCFPQELGKKISNSSTSQTRRCQQARGSLRGEEKKRQEWKISKNMKKEWVVLSGLFLTAMLKTSMQCTVGEEHIFLKRYRIQNNILSNYINCSLLKLLLVLQREVAKGWGMSSEMAAVVLCNTVNFNLRSASLQKKLKKSLKLKLRLIWLINRNINWSTESSFFLDSMSPFQQHTSGKKSRWLFIRIFDWGRLPASSTYCDWLMLIY